jgi:hypothetical protein
MRLLMLGGVDQDLEKVAAPRRRTLVGQKAPSQKPAWLLIKPSAAGSVGQRRRMILVALPESQEEPPVHQA